ncbi:uncharacterized protein LOC117153008 [Anabas testudineus]|uniref:uncharacterized protein LOC117153008 n=1 Tax=Anabas testudineus TaxID=64144 RepID=UPI00143D18EE|nr:uncharacterized protein LOC117153008 [Anabas testudineus]
MPFLAAYLSMPKAQHKKFKLCATENVFFLGPVFGNGFNSTGVVTLSPEPVERYSDQQLDWGQDFSSNKWSKKLTHRKIKKGGPVPSGRDSTGDSDQGSSLSRFNILCSLFTDHSHLVLFRLHEGVEVSESQDQQFSGRVQFDKDVLREGRIRLQLSRLRTNDSGLYLCDVKTDYGLNSGRCRLNVTAAADQHKPQRPTVSPPAEGPERIYLYTGLGLGLGLGLLLTAALLTVVNQKCLRKKEKKENFHMAEIKSLTVESGCCSSTVLNTESKTVRPSSDLNFTQFNC